MSATTTAIGTAAVFAFLAVSATTLPMAPAFGASKEDWAQCQDVNNEDASDRALAACNKILADVSEAQYYAMALRNRCGIWYTKGNNDRALADCDAALRSDPKSSIGYHRRGLIWYAKDDNDRAISDYSEAIRLDPKMALAWYNRSLAYKAKGDFDRAIADKAEAGRLDPKYAK